MAGATDSLALSTGSRPSRATARGARAGAPSLGVDLAGLSRAGLVIRVQRAARGAAAVRIDAVRILAGWEHAQPLDAMVPGVRLAGPFRLAGTAVPLVPEAIRRLVQQGKAAPAPVVGVAHVPDSLDYQRTDHATPAELLAKRAPRQAGAGSLLREQGAEAAVTHILPLARPHDGEKPWAALALNVRPFAVLDRIDEVQAEWPEAQPRVDLRALAPLRAFLALGDAGADETLIFSHLDVLDAVHVLVHRATASRFELRSAGLAQIAAAAAAETGEPVDVALARLAQDGVSSDPHARRAYQQIMNEVISTMRAHLERLAAAVANGEVIRPQRVILSGPATDDAQLATVRLQAAGSLPVSLFRPVAVLAQQSRDTLDPETAGLLTAHAGRFTVALGHALTPPTGADYALLPVDLTERLPLELLPADRRDPGTLAAPSTPGQGDGSAAAPTAVQSSLARFGPAFYLVGLAVWVPTGLHFVQARRAAGEVERLRADSAAAAGRVLDMQQAQAELAQLQARAGALTAIDEARGASARWLLATGAAMGSASHDVWLTGVTASQPTSEVPSATAGTSAAAPGAPAITGAALPPASVTASQPTTVLFAGAGKSPTAIASFLDGLKAQPQFRNVAFRRLDPDKNGTWRFEVSVTALPMVTGSMPGPGVAAPANPAPLYAPNGTPTGAPTGASVPASITAAATAR
jgi:hypothetical protein